MSSAQNTVVAGSKCRTAITQPGDAIISYRANLMRTRSDQRADSEPVAQPSYPLIKKWNIAAIILVTQPDSLAWSALRVYVRRLAALPVGQSL
jgi:hypothetical protein